MCIHDQSFFLEKTFTNGSGSTNFAKVFSLESFPLCGSSFASLIVWYILFLSLCNFFLRWWKDPSQDGKWYSCLLYYQKLVSSAWWIRPLQGHHLLSSSTSVSLCALPRDWVWEKVTFLHVQLPWSLCAVVHLHVLHVMIISPVSYVIEGNPSSACRGS